MTRAPRAVDAVEPRAEDDAAASRAGAASSGDTTIAAIATPLGPGERGVIRISGPRAREIARACFTAEGRADPCARRGLVRGRLDDGRGEQPALCLSMLGPRSFTREDVVELHLPGAPALLAAAFERVCALGAEPAAPGEFTRRAFLAGRIDLTRAEGVLALVSARNEGERRASTALLFGGLAERVAALRERLADLRALCEASLDFDESDTGHVAIDELAPEARAIAAELARALAWEEQRGRLAGSARIVLAGLPNAGKSALFNALAGAERALVSDLAGTTRDALAAEIDLGGVLCRLVDTAGVDRAARGVDLEAQSVGSTERETADVVVWVADAAAPGDVAAALGALDPARSADDPGPGAAEARPARVLAWNKVDLAGVPPEPPAVWTAAFEGRALSVSSLRGTGLDLLRATLAGVLADGAGAGLGRELSLRHRRAFEAAARELAMGLESLARGASLELFVEHLRVATDALDAITGTTTPDAILDRIFARFCIGK